MAHIEQANTATLDLIGQEGNELSQRSGSAGENGVEGRVDDGTAGMRNAGDSEYGKEAEKLSPATMNASDQADNPLLQPTPLPSLPTPPVSAASPSPTRPALVQHNSSQSHSGSSTPTVATAPHPKKFSSININKKFLEKTTSACGATSAMATASSSTKSSGNGASRPPTQSSSPHPRLVTTKLTAPTPTPSSVAGWSRPSSTAPPTSATGANSPNGITPAPSVPAVTTSSSSAPAAPQLPHPGKATQPGSRSALGYQQTAPSTASNKDGGSNASTGSSSKPVWGNVKPSMARLEVTSNDFPTAAEVAQVAASTRKSKPTEQPAKEVSTSPSTMTSSKPSRSEEADTFRGVHLDPNAHHWDEMVEDDDNYWDNVIEFGDGRQYKVEAVEQTSRSREQSPSGSVKSLRLESTTEVLVSKEERFADDFDRSWPSGQRRSIPINVPQRSPQEPPRVLFNERSNKMEPYSHRGGHGSFPSKRGGFHDRTISPTEPRSASIAFSKSSGGPPDFGSNRSRRFSTASNSSFVSSTDRDRPRDKDKKDGLPPSPHMPKGEIGLPKRPASLRGRDRDSEKGKDFDRGRHAAMGPPPVPAHAWRNPSRESVRHRLSISGSVNGAPSPRRHPTDEPSDFQGPSHAGRDPLHSPAPSHASVSTRGMLSPITPSLPLPGLGHDLEELKKDVMQSAAARAKQRRQQEEEEREAQKERARRKAAELELKMKAEVEEKARKEEEVGQIKKEPEQEAENERDVEATMLIKEALDAGEKAREDADSTSKPLHRRPLPQHSNDPTPSRRFASAPVPSNGAPPAETAETWRRSGPLPRQPDEPISLQHPSSSSVAFMPPPPPSPLDHLADGKQEDLEVVDFTDMGKFVGETTPGVSGAEQKEITKRASRPVASDFFDDTPSSLPSLPSQSLSPSAKNDIDTWRRKTPLIQITTSEQQVKGLINKDRPEGNLAIDISTSEQVHKANEGPLDSRYPNQVSPPSQRTPRTQNFYHQAPMSSLVDAISRIKGAIHDMHAEELSKESGPPEAEAPAAQAQPTQSLTVKHKEKWVPPSLRGRTAEFPEESREEFYRTVPEPPRSPKPAWNSIIVRLPLKGQEREPIHRKQLQIFSRVMVVRFDILSFEPPVEGMTKRSLSLNDVLFRPTFGGFKGKMKYRVQIPRSRNGPRNQSAAPMSSRTNSYGAFGKQNGADTSTSWRKPSSLPPARPDSGDEGVAEVNATSRSPPPEPEASSPAVGINSKAEVSSESSPLPPRTRSQPKMPEGSGVAFYRGSRIDVPGTEPKSLVNFIVSSEIDDPQPSQAPESEGPIAGSPANEVVETIHQPVIGKGSTHELNGDELKDGKAAEPPVESETARLSDSKSSDKSGRQPSPWSTSRSVSVKESPARAPDPELLKAVWSQTSDKAGLHTVNSLEGIADDLTSLPFTLQDVKSEGGETPPPAPGTSSSRMSLHDVTRAFQQVPSSSASTPNKPPISPPSTIAPVARPSPSNYPYPVPPNNMRPTYAAYPSPMMSHSPSPTMVYPQMVSSPVPTRIQGNGHTPMYNPAAMWVPVQHHTQNANNMMRPMGPPYAPQLMAYASNGAPTMYAAAMPANMPGTPQSQSMQANRNRNMPVMSPVMQHAGAHMYPASPAMMHMQMTPTSGYMPLPAGRGQPRPENGQVGMQQSASTHPPSSQVGFSPIPPSPFMRNW